MAVQDCEQQFATAKSAVLDAAHRGGRRADINPVNDGDSTRIYTYAMADQFERDLGQLKSEAGI